MKLLGALRYLILPLLCMGSVQALASAEGRLNAIVAFRADGMITAAVERLNRNFLCVKEEPQALELAGVRRDNDRNAVDEYLVVQNVTCPFSEGHVTAVVRFTMRNDLSPAEVLTTVTQVELTPVAPPPLPANTSSTPQ